MFCVYLNFENGTSYNTTAELHADGEAPLVGLSANIIYISDFCVGPGTDKSTGTLLALQSIVFCVNCSDTKPRRIPLLAFQTSSHSQPRGEVCGGCSRDTGEPQGHERLHLEGAPGPTKS